MTKPDWKKIVGTVAPGIAAALGGPLAGVAVKTIADKLLGKPSATEEEVEAAILGADPQTLVQLKQIDLEFKKVMADAGIKLEEIAAADRNSARQREIATGDIWTPRILAAFVIGLTIMLEGYAMLVGLPPEANEVIVGRILGTLDAASMMVLAYYFGSSASSKSKDDTISTIAKME